MSFRKYGTRTMKSYPRKTGYKRARKSYGSKSGLYGKYKSRSLRPSGPLDYAKGKELKLLETNSVTGGIGVPAGVLFPKNRSGANPAWQFIALNCVPSGSSVCSRIGRQVELQSLRVRIGMQVNDAFFSEARVFNGGNFRMMVVYDRQPNGAVPEAEDLLATMRFVGADVQTTASPFGNINVNNRERFKVLMDETVTLPTYYSGTQLGDLMPGSKTAGSNNGLYIDRYLKLKGLVTIFGADFPANTAGISDIKTGALYLVGIGGVITAVETQVSSPVVANYHCRLIYSDK